MFCVIWHGEVWFLGFWNEVGCLYCDVQGELWGLSGFGDGVLGSCRFGDSCIWTLESRLGDLFCWDFVLQDGSVGRFEAA